MDHSVLTLLLARCHRFKRHIYDTKPVRVRELWRAVLNVRPLQWLTLLVRLMVAVVSVSMQWPWVEHAVRVWAAQRARSSCTRSRRALRHRNGWSAWTRRTEPRCPMPVRFQNSQLTGPSSRRWC